MGPQHFPLLRVVGDAVVPVDLLAQKLGRELLEETYNCQDKLDCLSYLPHTRSDTLTCYLLTSSL